MKNTRSKSLAIACLMPLMSVAIPLKGATLLHNEELDYINFDQIQDEPTDPPAGVLEGLVGLWEFQDGDNIGHATLGNDLVIAGSEPSHEETRADGRDLPFSLEGVITTVHGVPNHLVATHDIGASGGGSRSNEYTLLFDVLVPGTGEWRCFYQTDPTNASNNDGEYFVRSSDNSLGRQSITYGPPAPENRWMRMVITADLTASGFFRTYIDGELHHNHSKPSLDSDFSLDPSELLLFADNDGENHPLVISKVAIVDRALEAAEVESLGGPGLSLIVPEGNTAPEVVAQTAGLATTETGETETYNFTATDADGDRVQVQVDWGDGTFSDWTTFVESGEAAPSQQSYFLPGVFTIRARARDIHGAVSDWVEIQEVTVSGDANLTILTPPYLQNMDTDRMVVMVEIEEDVELTVEYGLTSALGESVATTSVASGRPATSSFTTESYFHRGTITGLEPGTTYHYRVAGPGGGAITDISTFRTAPDEWEDFSFTALGDIQRDNQFFGTWAWEEDPWEPAKAMLHHMTTRGPSFFLGLGDHASDGNRYDRTRPSHLERVCEIFGTYAPFFIAWGNHDGNSPTHPLRLSADMPSRFRTDSFSTYTSGFGSFAFEYSGVFFVCLEHFACFTGAQTYITNAANNDITNGWLDSVLSSQAATDARFRVVAVHVPPFCERWRDGSQGLRDNLVPRLEQYNVDLCLSGHMHGYERGRINGVQYVISGGGSWLDIGEPLVANWSAETDDGLWLGGHVDVEGEYAIQSALGVLGDPEPIDGGLFHGYTEITVTGDEMRLDQHAFNADGSYIGILDTIIIDQSEPEPEPEPGTDGVFINFMTNQGSGANANAMTQAQAEAIGADTFVNVDVQGTGSLPRTWDNIGGVSGGVWYADWWQAGMKSALYDGGENPDQGFTGGVVAINGTHSAPNPDSRSSTVTLDVADFISDRGLSDYQVQVYFAGRQVAGRTALTNSEDQIVRIHDGTVEQTDYAQNGLLVEGAFWSGRGELFSFPAATETLTITTDSVGGTESGIAGVMILPGVPDGDPPAMVVEAAGPESVDALTTEGFSFSAVDPEGGMVEIQVDWGDGTISEWSDPVPSGQAVVFSQAFRQSGTYTVRARARGTNGVPSEWLEIQQVNVAPPEGALEGLVGLWEFGDGDDIGRATYGFDLEIAGSEPSHEETRADGRDLPFSLEGVITTVHGVPNHLVATHNIGASGGGSRSNEYTLVFDVLVPGSGEWRCFYQTDPANASNNDGEYFVRNSDNSLGRASITYGPPAPENRWMRLVITADLTEAGFFRTYIDGALHHNHSKPALDSDYSLDPSELLLFADNDGENHPLVVSKVAMVDRALDAAEVELLGGPGLSLIVPEGNTAPEVIAQTAGPTTAETGEPETYNFTATDAEGDRVQVQVDWGDGTFSDWTTFVDSGEAVPAQQSYSLPGVFTIRARARDIHGAVSDWVEIQDVTVTGEADITILTPPYLQNMDTDRMVVMVEVEEEVALAIEYGPTPALGQMVTTTSVASGRPATSSFATESYFHRGTITGLEPGTTYYYRLAGPGGGGLTDISTFRTAPDVWEDFTFMTIGDIQTDNRIRTSNTWAWEADPWDPAKKMLEHMTTRGPSFLLGLGDHAQDGNRYDRTRWSHLERVAEIFGTHAPFFIAWGNHDGNSPTHPLRLSADMPSRFRTDSFSTYTSGFGSFAFDYSGVFYVCLEHFTCFTGTHSYISNAANNDITNGWLDSVLSSSSARNARLRIVAIHVPPYCERWITGNQGLRDNLVPRLEQYNVDLCLSGHMHGYEHGLINGVQYVISGAGSYLDMGEPLRTNWSSITDNGQWVGGHIDIEGEYAMQSSLGVLGDPEPIEGGLFHGYSEITVRDRYLRLDQHGFNADGTYIGILDTIEINGPDPGPDSNGDGMRDAWKIAHGLDPFDDTGDNSPNADLDGDGMTNLQEYIAGTDPRDPQSRFTVDKVTTLDEDTVLLRWRSVPGRRYHIETSTDLLNWQRVEEMPDVPETFFGEEDSDFTEVEVVLPEHADERLFFRVEVTL